jgi:hypothetical protein
MKASNEKPNKGGSPSQWRASSSVGWERPCQARHWPGSAESWATEIYIMRSGFAYVLMLLLLPHYVCAQSPSSTSESKDAPPDAAEVTEAFFATAGDAGPLLQGLFKDFAIDSVDCIKPANKPGWVCDFRQYSKKYPAMYDYHTGRFVRRGSNWVLLDYEP